MISNIGKRLASVGCSQAAKEQLQEVIAIAEYSTPKVPGHYIFAGNPGTGKSSLAIAFAEILKEMGVLRSGHVITATADDFVSPFIGETAIRTRNLCSQALDGVLVVDEAYHLVNSVSPREKPFLSSQAEEAYVTLMNFMDDNASRSCVIFTGYKESMEIFAKANPGMARRISAVIDFHDCTEEELFQILKARAEQEATPQIILSDGFINASKKVFHAIQNDISFGNARGVISFLDNCTRNAIHRISKNRSNFPLKEIELLSVDIPPKYSNYAVRVSEAVSKGCDNTPCEKEETDSCDPFVRLPRSVIENLPNSYQDLDVHSTAFEQYCLSAIVRIETEYGISTAFVVTPDGYAITCAHSVTQKDNLCNFAREKRTAIMPSSEKFPFSIIQLCPDLDMALIKIDSPNPLPYLKLADQEREILFGEELALFGYPFGSKHIMRFSGSIASWEERGKAGENGYIHYIDGDAKPGYSGGPIIAKTDGCVIGILRGALGESEQALRNYMKPIKYFWKEFLK